MRVAYGNSSPTHPGAEGPSVTYQTIPDNYTYVVADSAADLAAEAKAHQADALMNNNGITRMGEQEALLAAVAGWRANSAGDPDWVWSDNEPFGVLLGAYFGVPVGIPDDVEERYRTYSGPPGVGPVNTDPDAEPAPPVLEGADLDKVQPPAEAAGEPEVSA